METVLGSTASNQPVPEGGTLRHSEVIAIRVHRLGRSTEVTRGLMKRSVWGWRAAMSDRSVMDIFSRREDELCEQLEQDSGALLITRSPGYGRAAYAERDLQRSLVHPSSKQV